MLCVWCRLCGALTFVLPVCWRSPIEQEWPDHALLFSRARRWCRSVQPSLSRGSCRRGGAGQGSARQAGHAWLGLDWIDVESRDWSARSTVRRAPPCCSPVTFLGGEG
eukprot:6198732-Pleurochrysis_carterae.AAC.2